MIKYGMKMLAGRLAVRSWPTSAADAGTNNVETDTGVEPRSDDD